MLPIRQSTPFLQRTVKVNPVQSSQLIQLLQTPPVVKISNVQDKPSTSRSSRNERAGLKAPKIESKEQQKEILTSLLMIMLGKKTFTQFEEKITEAEFSRANEKFYKLESLSSILRAESSLFSMKNRMAEIIVLTNEKAKREKITDTKESMKLFVASFIKEGINYHQLLNVLGSNKSNITEVKTIFSKRSYAPRKMERAQTKWYKAEKTYNTTLKKTGISESQITEYTIKCFHNEAFMKAVKKAFSFTLPEEDFKNILQVVETGEAVSDQEVQSLAQSAAAVEAKTKFTTIRPPVSQELWNSLQEASTEKDYVNKFYKFIYTNWDNESEQEKTTGQSFQCANILKERYDILLQKCFREHLRLSAINLIYCILKAKENHSELKKAKGEDWNNKIKQRDDSIRKAISMAKNNFSKNCLPYREKKEIPPTLTKDVLNRLRKRINKIMLTYRQIKNELNINNDLVFIDNVLNFLTSGKEVDRSDIISLIEKELISDLSEQNVNHQPCVAFLGKRSHELSDESDHDQPLKKKSIASQKVQLSQIQVQPTDEDKMVIVDDEVTSSSERESSLEDEFLKLPNIRQELIFEPELSSSQNLQLNFESIAAMQQAAIQQAVDSQDLETEVLAELFPRLTDLFPTEGQNILDAYMLPVFMRDPECDEEEN